MPTTNYGYSQYQVAFTYLDVSDVYGEGKFFTEAVMAEILKDATGGNLIISGFGTASPSGLNVNISIGKAFVSGYYVNGKQALTIGLTDNALNYIWLVLNRISGGPTDNKVYNMELCKVTGSSSAPFADSILLYKITTAAGAITVTDDQRSYGVASSITLTTEGDNSVVIPRGCFQVEVEMLGAGASGGSGGAGNGGGGGGGGAYVKAVYPVTPGSTYTAHIGVKGPAATGGVAGTAGGDTWFDVNTQKAPGGAAGLGGPAGGAGGAGGTVAAVDHNIIFSYDGGAGANRAGGNGGNGGAVPTGMKKGENGVGGAGAGTAAAGYGAAGAGGANGTNSGAGASGWMKIRF